MAGTITQTLERRGPVGVVTFTATADAADASFPDTVIEAKISGRLVALETNPGATAPTDNYDIVLDDAEDFDVLEGIGANRDTATTEKAEIVASGGSGVTLAHVAKSDVLTLKITNNSVNSAGIVIKLYFDGSAEA